MSELGTLRVWKDPAILTALSWYLDVAENRRPAKFHIAATIATELDPAESSEAALWAELDRVTPIFLARWGTISAGASLPEAAEGPSLLELCRELTYRMLAHCNFCPWSRGIGLETVKTALAAGHSVRALPRSAASIPIQNPSFKKVPGNSLDSDTIRH
jgi:putative pyruvate formate lyase activating enzyme